MGIVHTYRKILLKKIKDFIRFSERKNLQSRQNIKETLTLSYDEAKFISDLSSLNQPERRIQYSLVFNEGRPCLKVADNYGYNMKMNLDIVSKLNKLEELEFIMNYNNSLQKNVIS
ncbi:hypothetical protein [Aquirufa ecclesiirivi]|uniref:hypothetical protein n=1 Tax=Aquirufa ecclesiirivi TaxID=2715124 RepID=UPI003BB04551